MLEVVVNVDEKFWSAVDDVIELANQTTQQGKIDTASMTEALLNACARYSAFYLALNSEDKEALSEDKDAAVSRFTSEFKRLLASNVEDYIEHYKVYITK